MGRYWVIITQNKSDYKIEIKMFDDDELASHLNSNISVILFYQIFEKDEIALSFYKRLSFFGEKSLFKTIKTSNPEFNNLTRAVGILLCEK